MWSLLGFGSFALMYAENAALVCVLETKVENESRHERSALLELCLNLFDLRNHKSGCVKYR